MKLTKVLLIAAAPVLALGVTGAVLAFNPDDKPKETAQKQSATVTQSENDTDTTAVEDTPVTAETETEPVVEDEPAVPTPEENKAKVMQRITDYAASRGWGENTIYAETTCFDRAINGSIGYGSYEDLLDSSKFTMLQAYLNGKFMFDGTTCKQMWLE